MRRTCPVVGYGGVLVLLMVIWSGCAHRQMVAERRAQLDDEDMAAYCASGSSHDENGKPDPDCRRFHRDQVQREKAHRHRVIRALGAGLTAAGGGDRHVRCTTTEDGTQTDCEMPSP